MLCSILKAHAARWALASLPIAALLLLPATAVEAQAMYGCYVPISGTVYRIKTDGLPDKCRSAQHVEFTWSSQGVAGPQGPQGQQGPAGEQGPAGTISAAAVTVESNPGTIAAESNGLISVNCPAGKVATGGGGWSSSAGVDMIGSAPLQVGSLVQGWSAAFRNLNTLQIPVTAYAVCVPAS